ncbi:MAG: class I SAM-dependent methyltransferase [Desulfotignum sp.]|nr:class I SAM-dependent methyltransferase [Desulfotignum sp.]MCF8090058.1 class I SAM-dependent methyltransferase [Desulfotignum sp.]MCF8138376.1 class I SAM-dependent methyltransferase [Desulfotignum sp.]
MIYDKDNRQKTMIQQLSALDGCTVLEVGCGDGTLSLELANTPRRYLAIDPDHAAIARACRRPGRADFFIGSGEDLPFAGSTFDTVLFVLSLHHQNSRKALIEAHRVLIPEGRVIILEPDIHGAFQQFFHLFDDETDALTSAASAIRHSRFDLARQEVFEVPADFDDLSDLCQYPFDQSPVDDNGRSKIFAKLREFQGDINPADPIRLVDRIHISCLKKPLHRK